MRVDNRASIAYAAASARSVRRGLLSPEVLMRSGCASHARLTFCTTCSARGVHPYFSVGPSRQREALVWLPRRAGSSGISWRIHSLVKKTLHRPRAGFEPQRASALCEIVTLCRPPPHQDWGRARTAGNCFACDGKKPGPSWGKQLPGERPCETAET